MDTFVEQMTEHQIRWRRANKNLPKAWGLQNGKQFEWILPARDWEMGLWDNIRSGSQYSLQDFLDRKHVQRHMGAHNLKSSWTLCANLYFPFGASDQGRKLLASFLHRQVHHAIQSVDAVELEYAEEGDLNPSPLLGEHGGVRGAGQTSPDIAFLVNAGRGLILVENKFTEHSFYRCSARTRQGSSKRPGNPDPGRCNDTTAVINDPVGQCHQMTWGRRYWKHLAPVVRQDKMFLLRSCPAAYAGYQLFRQQALAEGIAASNKYDLVMSGLAIDERNIVLRKCLKATGIADIREWGELFTGKAQFALFSHQDWVGWVRERDDSGQWTGWLNYIEARYGFAL